MHVQHFSAAFPEVPDYHAGHRFGHVGDNFFERLFDGAVLRFARDHARAADGKLVAFPAHRLHQNRQVKLATT